jgi:hypothetical protein
MASKLGESLVDNIGEIAAGTTVRLKMNTFSSLGASVTVTNLAATDVHIHKDADLTQRASAAGITVSIDFDGITGCHIIEIDTSDDTDAGFYEQGKEYQVRLEGITVDGQTLNPWIGGFSIERTYLGEPTAPSIPPLSASIQTKIQWLYTAWRNKVLTTDALITIRDDTDAASIATGTVSDDGTTMTKEKYI